MANPNKPTGLSPVKYLNGSDWDGRGNMYYIDSTSTNALYPGDPVKLVAGLDTKRGIQSVDLATAGATAVGVIVAIGTNPDGGPYIDPTNLTLINAPATKTKSYYALVCDDPNVIFEIQEGNGGPLTQTSTSKNANFIYAAPATGAAYSGVLLDDATVAVTSTLNLKILGLQRRADNAYGAFAKWLVLLNNHSYRTGIAGI